MARCVRTFSYVFTDIVSVLFSYLQYANVNDWFTRKIISWQRPISSPLDDRVIVAAADSRVIVCSGVFLHILELYD